MKSRLAALVPSRLHRPTSPATLCPPGGGLLAGLAIDARWALRIARRDWRPTLVVIATIGLGIAACTTMTSIAYALLVKPLPWPEADRLVQITETRQGSTRPPLFFTSATYHAWRESPQTIEDLAGYQISAITMTDPGEAERIDVARVTPNLLPLLRVRPAAGLAFEDSPDENVDERQVAISHALWQRRFGGRGDVIGSTVAINGEPHVVSAVMPEGFAFPDSTVRAWLPMRVPPVTNADGTRSLTMLRGVARLRPGVTPAQTAEEATARGSAVDAGLATTAVFGSDGPLVVITTPLVDALLGDVRPALIVLLIAVGALLATATANVASLQLARAVTRRRETAVRAAIGAGAARLVRQRLVENLFLGLGGAALGLLAAGALHAALPALLPADVPRVDEIAFDWRAAALATALGVLASLVFGLAPTLQARRLDLVPALIEDGQAPAGMAGHTWAARMRLAIITAQVATACVLLAGGALLARSFLALRDADRGYDPRNLLTARLAMPGGLYDGHSRAAALERIVERLRAHPGVRSAAFTSALPFAGYLHMSAFRMAGPDGAPITVSALQRQVSVDFLPTLGYPLEAGRFFDASDTADALPVTIVNREFARQYLGSDPLAGEFPQDFSRFTGRLARVIGVVGNVSYRHLDEQPQPEMFRVVGQMRDGLRIGEPLLAIRTAGPPSSMVPALREIVAEESRSLALDSVLSMEDRLGVHLARPRLYAVGLIAFAVSAALLAGVGLFGALSYAVAQRTREIGIRTALGATSSSVVRLVLSQALCATAAGLVLGLAGAAAGTRLLGSLLHGVGSADPLSFGIAAVLVAVLASIACALPARRAASVDPATVLK